MNLAVGSSSHGSPAAMTGGDATGDGVGGGVGEGVGGEVIGPTQLLHVS
eukprot:CAMPEP_0202473738 /NCGR_PEP_ID=MMETSP1360-20130828/91880_1 /ASSEMBLY_ACC=CAM_ASM_000848 /TAXON_ID=515479 /ORGANISM="Licmophora paradoxa, Strain CCMP2313" /LENGTH=48 /DNA_ID= /DNA_START= /DNA_END= /DNA_ORIENTATION=